MPARGGRCERAGGTAVHAPVGVRPTRGAARDLERHESSASASTSAGRSCRSWSTSRHSRKRPGAAGRWQVDAPGRGAARAARERPAGRREAEEARRQSGRSQKNERARARGRPSRRSDPVETSSRASSRARALEDATRERGPGRGGDARVTQTERRSRTRARRWTPRREHKLELEARRSWAADRARRAGQPNGASPSISCSPGRPRSRRPRMACQEDERFAGGIDAWAVNALAVTSMEKR